MKTKTAAIALLLLAGTARAAMAQEQGHDRGQGGGGPHENAPRERPMHPRGEAHERAVNGGQPGGQQGGWRQPQPPPPPAAPEARPAPPAPAPQPPRAEGQHGGHWRGGPPGQVAGRPGGEGRPLQGRPDRWVDRDGEHPGQVGPPGDRADHDNRQELRDSRRFNGGRVDQGRGEDHRRDDHRWAGRDGDHRPDGDWNRGDRNRGDWNRGDWRGRPQWRPGAYPHSFHSARRYRVGPYYRPPHYYAHVWTFGEILPGAWYATDYLIDDWWNYDLPEPPPGFDWVRVGDDALLVDQYTGQIVQVVRELFW
jgi:Ni/Co efflux regulator RcnB